MGRLGRRLLGIAPEEVSFTRRRFRCEPGELRDRLEEVGHSFVAGYHAALEANQLAELIRGLEEVKLELRGFAYEGAAMALTLLDALTPWRRDRLRAFLAGPADPHVYLVHVGAGWALARLPISPASLLARLDPVLRWLAIDGYGFHQGFFHAPAAIGRQLVPGRLRGYARRAFDQGLGRSLWFVEGADSGRIAAAITAFPAPRQADLWSGVGLACAYAGGRDRAAIEQLRIASGGAAGQLAQGACFAVTARQRAGNPTPFSALASEVLCRLPQERVAEVAVRAQPGAAESAAETPETPAFELWRLRIVQRLSEEGSQP